MSCNWRLVLKPYDPGQPRRSSAILVHRPRTEQFNAHYGYAGSYRAAGVHVIK